MKSILVVILLTGFAGILVAQQLERSSLQEKVKPPTEESFTKTSAVAIPKRSVLHTCWALTPNPKPDCPQLSDDGPQPHAWMSMHFLTIYNRDADIYYEFSVDPKDPRFYRKLPTQRKDFHPLGPELRDGKEQLTPPQVFLRLVAESPSWYEVEISEETHETRFIKKSDRLWAKITWADVFNQSDKVLIDPVLTKILDRPDGKPLPDSDCTDTSGEHTFSRLEGDWMRVNDTIRSSQMCRGWIRWRDGRKILVGSILNGMQVPRLERE